jgi:hypothetical protein
MGWPRSIARGVLSCVLVLGGFALVSTTGTTNAVAAGKQKPKKDKGGGAIAKKAKTPPKDGKNGSKPAMLTPSEPAPADDAPSAPRGELRGPTRIDFDDRLIQGQTNKSGAVYLFDRKETGISSMVRRRKSFRQLTLGTIYDR